MAQDNELKSIHAYFSGMVQGVGFRFVAKDLAFRYKVKGWVKNLADGRVEMAAQARQKDLNVFLEGLRAEFKNHIADSQIEEFAPSQEYDGFKILF